MKALLIAFVVSLSFAAHANLSVGTQDDLLSKKGGSKSEPAPKDQDERQGGGETPDSREETYEGNDRNSGGSFDGGGYEGDGGGMSGEIFRTRGGKVHPVTTRNLKTEDRGSVIIYTSTEQEDFGADETCTTVTTTVVDKVTQKVISTDSQEFCNRWPL